MTDEFCQNTWGILFCVALMVDGHTIDNDGKLWTLTLREGLRFHDGERVLARDCVARVLALPYLRNLHK